MTVSRLPSMWDRCSQEGKLQANCLARRTTGTMTSSNVDRLRRAVYSRAATHQMTGRSRLTRPALMDSGSLVGLRCDRTCGRFHEERRGDRSTHPPVAGTVIAIFVTGSRRPKPKGMPTPTQPPKENPAKAGAATLLVYGALMMEGYDSGVAEQHFLPVTCGGTSRVRVFPEHVTRSRRDSAVVP